jgi:hypothetical protein
MEYASFTFNNSHRTHVFTFCIMPDTARILRWDHSGVIYSDLIHWRTEPHLAEFFWRIGQMDDAQRGFDPTVSELAPDSRDVAEARKIAFVKESHSLPRGVSHLDVIPMRQFHYKFDVWHKPKDGEASCGHPEDVHDASNERPGHWHHFVVHQPRTPTRFLVGRYTRGYIAVDLDVERLVWLKDAWRLTLLQAESDTYRDLQNSGVREHLPGFVFGDDVCSDPSNSKPQEAATHAFAITHEELYWCNVEGAPPPDSEERVMQIEPHTHHRMVFEKIGRSLGTFDSTKQLCGALRDVLKGPYLRLSFVLKLKLIWTVHHQAATDAQILHRDISDGNVLIDKDGNGMLIDWDLCCNLNEEGARRFARTVRIS